MNKESEKLQRLVAEIKIMEEEVQKARAAYNKEYEGNILIFKSKYTIMRRSKI